MNRHHASRKKTSGALLILAFCACLLLPASALAYGGGGGDVGGSNSGNSGPDYQGLPGGFDSYPGGVGPEGVPLEPADGHWGGYYTPDGKPTNNPTPQDSPWNTPGAQFIADMVKDQIKDKVLDMVLASNPQLLATIKVVEGAHGVYTFTKETKEKLDKAKKDYQKALMGTLGSNLQMPGPEIPDLNSYQPGGGPAPLHDNNFLQ